MKKLFSGVILTLGLLAVATGAFTHAARSGWLTPDDTELRARYALPDSKFIDIDGEPIHVVDQGRGPAILLLHGSFGSLRMWNDWAAALSPRYRVIRFDRPPMGLSGPNPEGRYDTAREMQIISTLTTRLGIDQFFLVATSSAGVVGAAYAADHPQRVRGVILANIAVGKFSVDRNHLSTRMKWLLRIDPWFRGWHPAALWEEVLLANFHHPERVTPRLAREWADLNNRAQRMPRRPGGIALASEFDRTPQDLARIRMPALLLWSQHDHELPVETMGARGLALLAAADKRLVIVPDCGHMMPLECGPESGRLAAEFFDRVVAAGRTTP